MPRRSRILGLDQFRLTPASLTGLGRRSVRLTIQLAGAPLASLRQLRPDQRIAFVRHTLTSQLNRLQRRFPLIDFVPRGKGKPPWTIDAVAQADQVAAIASGRYVQYVSIETVEDRKKLKKPPKRPALAWFCVRGVVAIQVEGRIKGIVTIEDELVLVKAKDPEDAKRRLDRFWTRYAEPYMNADGNLVRWQLISIRDVYELTQEQIDPRGTEVYSELRSARMRPDFRWRSGKSRARPAKQ